jgi:hypothetical protein
MTHEAPNPSPLVPPTPVPLAGEEAEYPFGGPYSLAQWRAAALYWRQPPAFVNDIFMPCMISFIAFNQIMLTFVGMERRAFLAALVLVITFVFIVRAIPLPVRYLYSGVVYLLLSGFYCSLAYKLHQAHSGLMGAAMYCYGAMFFYAGYNNFKSFVQARHLSHVPKDLRRQLEDVLRRLERTAEADREQIVSFSARHKVGLMPYTCNILLLGDYALLRTSLRTCFFLRREEIYCRTLETTMLGTVFEFRILDLQVQGTTDDNTYARLLRWRAEGPAVPTAP